jgi:hypothetical protein
MGGGIVVLSYSTTVKDCDVTALEFRIENDGTSDGCPTMTASSHELRQATRTRDTNLGELPTSMARVLRNS